MSLTPHLPSVELEPALERALAELDATPERVGESASWLLNTVDAAHVVVGASIALNRHEDALRGLRALEEAGQGIMAASFALMREKPSLFEGHIVPLDVPPVPLSSPDNWMRAFFAALTLRDEAATLFLCAVPGRELLNERVQARPYAYHATDALRGFRLDADRWQDVLALSLRHAAADPKLSPYDREIVLPVLHILEIIYVDVPTLDERIAAALQSHRSWWSEPSRAGDPRGMVALGPLALAVWAHSCGLTTTIESDYLHRWLVESHW